MKVLHGDNIELLKQYPDNYFDAIVTDAPYGLGKEPNATELMKDWIEKGYHEVGGSGFMGKQWDAFVPQPLFWKEVFRVLKHGGHVLSFFGSRTYDWGVMAMRFAGFEVRDCIQWVYGSGFPKSNNIHNTLKNDLQCKVEKKNVINAITSSFQLKEAKEMDGQNIVVENVLAKVSERGVIEFVKIVKNNSMLHKAILLENQEVNKEHFVLLNVNLNGNKKTSTLKIILIGKEENLLEPMDTLELTLERENIDLNILSLWKHISEEELKKERMFTTLTGIEKTTELKICNYFLNPNIQKFIVNNHSALKPANEPIVLARKPLEKGLSIAENVLKWGTGAINIDGCRVGTNGEKIDSHITKGQPFLRNSDEYEQIDRTSHSKGRFPANLILSHSFGCQHVGTKKVGKGERKQHEDGEVSSANEGYTRPNKSNFTHKDSSVIANYGEETIEDWNCVEDCPIKILDEQSGESQSQKSMRGEGGGGDKVQQLNYRENSLRGHSDKGGASRFFQQCNFEENDIVRFQYTAKASKSERNKGLEGFEEKVIEGRDEGQDGRNVAYKPRPTPMANVHPTVKPIKLMQYLVRLVTPPNGIVLDPFCGSGTTGIACKLEGFKFIGLEQDAEYCKIAQARIDNYVEDKKQSKKSSKPKEDNNFQQPTLF